MDASEHRTTVQLRWRDMDMLGHLNQSVYHELLEEARAGLMMGMLRDLDGGGPHGAFVLARVELDYHREVRRDHGTVEIVVRVAEVGRSSVRLGHDVVLPDGSVAASGVTVLVAWDPAGRCKRELLPAERSALSP